MLTQPPPAAAARAVPSPIENPDDLSGHTHRQVIGYLGLALPILLVQAERLRPNAASDRWYGGSISDYYWTGAVSLFVGLLAALSLFLLTYRGYDNATQRYDRAAAIIAGVSAAVVALFPTTPPPGILAPPAGIAPLPWWHEWIAVTHQVAAIILFSTFAVFSLWLFRQSAPDEPLTAEKKRRNAIYVLCGVGIVASMTWALVAGLANRSIFWPESLALGFFAWSWLTKGRALHSVKATLGVASTAI
jgi:hypothetical protein